MRFVGGLARFITGHVYGCLEYCVYYVIYSGMGKYW